MSAQPTLDPQFVPFLQALASLPPLWSQSVQDVRKMWDLSVYGRPEEVGAVRELTIPVADGTIAARLYTPKIAPTALLVFYHGGGWVVGSLETHDLPLRALTNLAGVAILSVDYRLAPEHPFPTGLQDCYAALEWADEQQADLVGGRRPLLVGGDSAGGNLAAVVALMARDRAGPKIDCQVLIYPATDGSCTTPSYTERAAGGLMTSRDMSWFWNHYIADERRRMDPLASPSKAASHRDLPAAVVVIAEFDPLRDEGLQYAQQLRTAGNAVTVLRYDTLPHGFLSSVYIVGAAGAAVRQIALQIREEIAKVGTKV